MPSPNPLMRLISADEIGNATINQLLSDMDDAGAGQVAITLSDGQNRVRGGLVCLHGPEAQRYMDAINAVTQQIENEEQDDRSQS